MFELKRDRIFMFHGTDNWFKIWRNRGLCFQRWDQNLANFHWLKDSDFIFESKMVVLNETKNLKQLNLPHAVTKPILPWK